MKIMRTLQITQQFMLVLAASSVIVLMGACNAAPAPSQNGATNDNGQSDLPPDSTPDATPTFAPDFETVDITMQEGAKQLSDDTMQDATMENVDGGTRYVFPATSTEAADVQLDDVVLFSGMSLGRVIAVTTDESSITIDTESATLDEFVADGTIAWGYTVDFDKTPDPQISAGFEDSFTMSKRRVITKRRDPNSQLMIETGGDSFTFSGKVNEWDVSLTLTPISSRINLSVSASRAINGNPVISITGEGFVTNFRQTASIEYTGGVASNVEFGQEGLQGEMNLQWSAFNTGDFVDNALVQLRFPVEIPIPTTVGGIPVLLKIKAVARVIPQLNFPDMSSQGSFKVEYDGNAGFTVADSTASPSGSLTSAEFSVSGETVSAGSVTVGLGMGLEFPRLEISLLGNSASAFITLDTFASGFFEPGIQSNVQPCQYGSIINQVIAGYQFSVLGLVGVSGSTEIWKDEETFYLDGEPCD